MIAGMINNKKTQSSTTKLFIRERKLNISTVLVGSIEIGQTKFCTLLLWTFQANKNFNKLDLITLQILALQNLYKKCTGKQFFFGV